MAHRSGLPSFTEMMRVADANAAERVRLECICGWTWTGPQRARWWIHEKHCEAHARGRDGLTAVADITAWEADGEP